MAAFRTAMLLGLALCILPVMSVDLASWTAWLNGCLLNEVNTHPCRLMGLDIGGLLTSLFGIGWLMLLTIPLGSILILVWAGTELVQFVRRRMAREQPEIRP